jgi:hypothetical protein
MPSMNILQLPKAIVGFPACKNALYGYVILKRQSGIKENLFKEINIHQTVGDS